MNEQEKSVVDTNIWDVEQPSLYDDGPDRDVLCFDIFFKDGPFGLILLDHAFRILKINDSFTKMTQLSSPILKGRTIYEFLDWEDALKLKSVILETNSNQIPLIMSLGFLQKSKTILATHTYVRKYQSSLGDQHYCLLVFEKEFCPNPQLLELQQQMYNSIIDTQERERQNIGSLLHDSLAQLLYAARLNLQSFLLENKESKGHIMPVKKLLNEAIHIIRNISMELVPSVLHDFGLKVAINSMTDRISIQEFQINTWIQEQCELLPEGIKLAIYRIVQELLNNCIKHSLANKIEVSVIQNKGKVVIQVSDNGGGFESNIEQSMKQGSGLRGIKSSVDQYGGQIKVSSTKTGVRVKAVLKL